MQNSYNFEAKPLFVESIPIFGEVPLCFYIPKSSQDDDIEHQELLCLIQKYGGLQIEFHECFTFQIEPLGYSDHSCCLQPYHYFRGNVYSARWLIDSVKEGKLLDKDKYLSFYNEYQNCKQLEIFKKNLTKKKDEVLKLTLREAFKVYQIGQKNQQKAKVASFWLQVERDNLISPRNAFEMRNAWQIICKKGLKNYMNLNLDDNTYYCHSFQQIPKVQLRQVNFDIEAKIFERQQQSQKKIGWILQEQKYYDLQIQNKNKGQKKKQKEEQPDVQMNIEDKENIQIQSNKDYKVIQTTEFQDLMSQQLKVQLFLLEQSKNNKNFEKNQIDQEEFVEEITNLSNKEFQNAVQKSEMTVYKLQREELEKIGQKSSQEDSEKLENEYVQQIQEANQRANQLERKAFEVDICSMSSQECFFTLVATKMMKLSAQYQIPLTELHQMFYNASCNFHQLQCILDQQSNVQWNAFEDFALLSEDNESYQYILEQKGEQAVKERRQFLHIH